VDTPDLRIERCHVKQWAVDYQRAEALSRGLSPNNLPEPGKDVLAMFCTAVEADASYQMAQAACHQTEHRFAAERSPRALICYLAVVLWTHTYPALAWGPDFPEALRTLFVSPRTFKNPKFLTNTDATTFIIRKNKLESSSYTWGVVAKDREMKGQTAVKTLAPDPEHSAFRV